jgi:hypothetical protein
MGTIKVIKMDLHGYHPSEIVQTDVLKKIIQQTWEMGENYVTLIHGHGRNRGISPGFVNTNTGYFGLEIRRALRHDKELRQWIRYTTLDCSDMGVTRVKLKPNPAPTRNELDQDLLPEAKLVILAARWRRSSAMSADRCETGIQLTGRTFRFWRIVLKKSFLGDERKFLRPLMRFARGGVRGHIVSLKNDHGSSYRRYRDLQR